MSGLRQKQKAHRHDRILEAAAELFREFGYEAVKMEAIAAAAEVSIGTIYNYYQNKGDLLVAIVALEVHEVLKAGEEVIARPPHSAEKRRGCADRWLHRALVALSQQGNVAAGLAISTQQPASPFGETFTDLDVALARQTCGLIEKLQALDLLDPQADARSLGEIIFNNTNMNFITFVKTEAMSIPELRASCAASTAPSSQGWKVAAEVS